MTKMTLVLHIGTEKTGTTLIQKWLYQNRGELLDQGVFLSNKLGWENNRQLVAYFRSEPDEFWTFNNIESKEDKERFFSSFLDDFEKEIEQAAKSHHTMVITSEHFHSRLTDENDIATFSEFCRKNFKDHIVICYLRPQWEVRKSLYSTDLKNNEVRNFLDYRSDIGSSDKYFNYLELYRRWKRNFAYAKMDFRNYSRGSFIGNDIRLDFVSSLPASLDTSRLEFSNKRENESLSLLESAAYAAINKTVPLFDRGRVNARNYDYKKLVSSIADLRVGKVRDPLAHKIYDGFRASNNELFSEVFSGVDVFGYPKDEDGDAGGLSLEEAALLVQKLVACFISYFDSRTLSEPSVDLIRDAAIALRNEGRLDLKDAIRLLEVAANARPNGPLIKSKIAEWREELGGATHSSGQADKK